MPPPDPAPSPTMPPPGAPPPAPQRSAVPTRMPAKPGRMAQVGRAALDPFRRLGVWTLSRYTWGTIRAGVRREIMRFLKDRGRWVGLFAQPLMLWLILGLGIGERFQVEPGVASAATGAGGYAQWFFPGMLAMSVLFSALGGTLSLVEDRHNGLMKAVLAAPGGPRAAVLGKCLGVALLAVPQALILALLAPFAGYPFLEVNWPLLGLMLALSALTLTAMNLALAWLLDSSPAHHAVMSVVLLPLWALSGALFPRAGGFWGWVSLGNPFVPMVDGFRDALGVGFVGELTFTAALGFLTLWALGSLLLAVIVVSRR